MLTLQAISVASAAAELCEPGFQAQIHSAFERVVNLSTQAGQLFTLLEASLGELPNALLVELPAGQGFLHAGLARGQRATGDGRQLIFPDAGIGIYLDPLRRYSSRKSLEHEWVGPEELQERLRQARTFGSRLAPGAGLAPLWQDAGRLADLPEIGPTASPLIRQALPALTDLMRGFIHHDWSQVGSAAARLSGLGIGLTPSGDDLLTGFLAAVSLLAATAQREALYAGCLDAILKGADGRTNRVAWNYLVQARRGEISSALAGWIKSLVSPQGGSVEEAVVRLFSFGATSGSELALGAYLGVELISRTEPFTV